MAAHLARSGGAPQLTCRQTIRCGVHGMSNSVCLPQKRIHVLQVSTQAKKGFGLPTSSPKNKCPCGSGKDYSACCQKLHQLQQLKVTGPEQLLRARFSAYIKKDWKYVVRTTHSRNSARQGSTSSDGEIKTTLEQDVKVTMRWADLSNLQISKVRPGASPDQAEVDFKYNMRQLFELKTGEPIKDPPCQVISETAVFEVEDGEWKLLGSQQDWGRNNLQQIKS